MIRVLFVCAGNICRSPIAQGVFEDVVRREGLSDEIQSDSAGTTAFHVGSAPDRRAARAAQARGIDLEGQWARQITPADLQDFDYVLVMDHGNYQDVLQLASQASVNSYVGMFMDYAYDLPDTEVLDPYYGNGDGFERALDLTEAASIGLLANIKQNYFSDERV